MEMETEVAESESVNNQSQPQVLVSGPHSFSSPSQTVPSPEELSQGVHSIMMVQEEEKMPSPSDAEEDEEEEDIPPGLSEVPDRFVKKYIFRSKSRKNPKEFDIISVIVPEQMMSNKIGYGLRVWPSAPILAWYLYEHREYLENKRVLELGSGTALAGVVTALCGAKVILSDSAKFPHCLESCRKVAEINGVEDRVQIMGLTWGLFLNNVTKLRNQLDLIIGADCFFDPVVFEDLVSTVAYLLENNRNAKFLTTYQVRSSDWSIEHLLKKWGLRCKYVPLKDLANECRVDLLGLMQNHTIQLLEITLHTPES